MKQLKKPDENISMSKHFTDEDNFCGSSPRVNIAEAKKRVKKRDELERAIKAASNLIEELGWQRNNVMRDYLGAAADVIEDIQPSGVKYTTAKDSIDILIKRKIHDTLIHDNDYDYTKLRNLTVMCFTALIMLDESIGIKSPTNDSKAFFKNFVYHIASAAGAFYTVSDEDISGALYEMERILITPDAETQERRSFATEFRNTVIGQFRAARINDFGKKQHGYEEPDSWTYAIINHIEQFIGQDYDKEFEILLTYTDLVNLFSDIDAKKQYESSAGTPSQSYSAITDAKTFNC